jgi:hypothetical protein
MSKRTLRVSSGTIAASLNQSCATLGLAIPDKLLAVADEVMSEAQRHGAPEMI